MTLVDVDVSRYSLAVDARETVDSLLDSADRERGARLDNALRAARGRDAAFAVMPGVTVGREDFRPGPPSDGDWPEVSARHVSGVLRELENAALVETHTVLSETCGSSYLSDGRVLTAVRVVSPFTVVTVHYAWSSGVPFGYADRWTITGRTDVVGAGTYLVGEVGDFSTTYVGATAIDTAHPNERGVDLDTLACWAAEQEGMWASRCEAGCDACGARWIAHSGSWHFQADCDAPRAIAGFAYDDTEDHDGATIACPNCAVGRVGFLIF